MSSPVVRHPGQLDLETRRRLQDACDYINAEIRDRRARTGRGLLVGCLLTVIVYVLFTRAGYEAVAPLGVIYAIVFTLAYVAHVTDGLNKAYKEIVVRRVVSAIGPDLIYSPGEWHVRKPLPPLDILRDEATVADAIRGRKGAVSFSIMEVSTSAGSGLLARLDFNKRFRGQTAVIAQDETKTLAGHEAERWKGKEIVTLENAEFERQFTVYSTDQQQARYLLTPKLMDLVLEAQAALGSRLRLSFRYNSVFVYIPHRQKLLAIRDRENRFEIPVFGQPVTPEGIAGELAELMALIERLIDILELETRIWSRE